jgi:sugar phosphate isomerase/epimerase
MSQAVKLHVFAAHWGHAGKPAQQFIDEVKAAGFDGIEMSLPADEIPNGRTGWSASAIPVCC